MKPEHHHSARVVWTRGADEPFVDARYRRAHQWHFDGGLVVPASSSPLVVPLPMSEAGAVDPEEAFVAALSSCHMLFFLSFAAKARSVVDRYEDEAYGEMGRNAERRMAILRVVLQPRVSWSGAAPVLEQVQAWHEQAHHECFIANSVRTQVRVMPR